MHHPYTDFHYLNAVHWGCSRPAAKSAAFNHMYANLEDPRFLDWIHPDNRAAILQSRGIILGDE